MESLNRSMQADLIELWKTQDSLRGTGATAGTESTERHLRELLEQTRSFVSKYRPASYTVTVGSPFGAGVSFTWEGKEKPEFRFLANA